MRPENEAAGGTATAGPRRIRRAAGTAALLALGAVAGLLVAEVVVAVFLPQLYRRPEVWQHDADLGWSHLPSSSGRLITPEYDVEMRINAEGLRDRPVGRAKPSGVERTLVFGDSFVEGWGVEVEECLSRQLEKLLQGGREGSRAQVLNFGVAGYGTDQELLFFEESGRHFRPDHVVIVFYANDLWNNASPRGMGAERGYKPYFRPVRDGRLSLRGVPVPRSRFWDGAAWAGAPASQRLIRYLAERWHLFALVRGALAPEVTKGEQRAFYGGLYGVDEAGEFSRVWDLSARILAEFGGRIRQAGARPLLAYAPSIVQVDAENWRAKQELHGLVGEYDLGKPNRLVAAIAERHAIPYLDLGPVFAQAPAKPRLYYRDSHWTPAGHALAARALADVLVRRDPADRDGGGSR